jgi:hypothetical protein
MRTNLVKAAACVGVALAVALIGWTPGSSPAGPKASAAVGPPSVVLRLPNQGVGLNGGKDIRVRVSVTCSNAVGGPITVHIRQQRGNRVISGVGTSSKNYRCNGRTQVVPVLVSATRGFFVPGAANASANVQVCNPTGSPCTNGSDTRTISLVAPNTTSSSSSSSSSIP